MFVAVYELMAANDHHAADPMPIKYCLWRQGRIKSPECRLPLTSISRALGDELVRLGHGRVKSAA